MGDRLYKELAYLQLELYQAALDRGASAEVAKAQLLGSEDTLLELLGYAHQWDQEAERARRDLAVGQVVGRAWEVCGAAPRGGELDGPIGVALDNLYTALDNL